MKQVKVKPSWFGWSLRNNEPFRKLVDGYVWAVVEIDIQFRCWQEFGNIYAPLTDAINESS